jgi:riboflavin kinase/FMN adenylyltransferase
MTDDIKNTVINASSLSELTDYAIKRVFVAIGTFDGVHIGHQYLIKELLKKAKETSAVPVILTFFPHPREVLMPKAFHQLIITHTQKVELLHHYGIKAVVTIPFSKEFASVKPDVFVKKYLLTEGIELCGICVGNDWKFGSDASGGAHVLEKFAKEGFFEFKPIDIFKINGVKVSSTDIRKAVLSGNIDKAARMLGRPYAIRGSVEKGFRIAGSKLNCPTANIKSSPSCLLPPNGIYAGYTLHKGKKYDSAIIIGVSPTFKEITGSVERRIETHIFDFSGDLYGSELEIEFVKFIRDEKFFQSIDDLNEQIKKDINEIQTVLRH